MEEIFDIFTEDHKSIGTATRSEAHKKGFWHQTFHCWVVHETMGESKLLLQLRHPLKDTHPNQLDTSCAGHLEAGEIPADGIRELHEELGLDVEFKALHPAGVYSYSDCDGDLQDNEFCHVFVYINEEGTLNSYLPAQDEISGLFLVELEAFKKLCRQLTQSVLIKGFEITDSGDKIEQEREITLKDLVKNQDAYYELLFQCLDRLTLKRTSRKR